MNVCDIDRLRDLLVRLDRAKDRQFSPLIPNVGTHSDPVAIERQLQTYLAQGTTVAALTKCVEQVEAETEQRIAEQERTWNAQQHKFRILRICNRLEALEACKCKGKPVVSDVGLSFALGERIERSITLVRKEIGDPYDA